MRQVKSIEEDGTVSVSPMWVDDEDGTHALMPWEDLEQMKLDQERCNIGYRRLREKIRSIQDLLAADWE